MFSTGAYGPDPTEGITAIADLPPPEIVPYSRTYERQACPRCTHQAYRDKQCQRTLQVDGNQLCEMGHGSQVTPGGSATQVMLPLSPDCSGK